MKKVYFITGSQDLYGEDVLLQVAADSKVIASYLNEKIDGVEIEYATTVRDEASCIEAYQMAKEFFTEIEGEEKPFVCHSWLLYPAHEEILNHNSNTYKFFSRFDVFESGDNEGDDLWRLFDTEDRNPDRLPTNSSFRRNYVEHLKKGGLVGWGYGVFFF